MSGAAAFGLASQSHALALPQFLTQGGPESSGGLVVIYLRGGADFLNMIVPLGDKDYEAARPTLKLGGDDGVLELNKKWGLHPSMSSFKELWDSGNLLPIVCAGSPHRTRSHFDAQDFMEFAAPGNRTQRQGWLNRYLAATTEGEPDSFRSIAIQGLLPRSLRGEFPVLAMPSNFGGRKDTDTLDAFEKFYGAGGMGERPDEGDDILASGTVTIETLRRFQEILTQKTTGDFGYPKSNFATALQRISQLFEAGAGLQIAGLDYNGWDTHTGQGAADGSQARMLANLTGSLAAFCRQLGPRLKTTTIMIMTEFGRTVHENGNNGTDHGHGSGMFLLGGGLEGGRVHGEWRGLDSGSLYQGRDLPVTTDFRDVFAEVLRERLDFKLPKGFFDDYSPHKIGLFA